jgi:hypothetical protein
MILGSLGYVAAFWRSCRPPRPGFALGRYRGQQAFAAPMSPLVSGGMSVTQFSMIGVLAPIDQLWRGAWSDPELRGLAITLAVLSVVFFLVHVALQFRPPHLRVTPEGLVVARLTGRLIPWDALASGGPTGNQARHGALWLQARAGTVGLGGPHPLDLDGRPPLPGFFWYRLKLNATLADPAFLADALRTYRDDATRRSAIGTAGELAALAVTSPVHLQGRPASAGGGRG